MVELEPLNDRDDELLRGLIRRHAQYTGSTVATGLLAEWATARAQFKKVMPTEYRKIVESQHLSVEAQRLAAV